MTSYAQLAATCIETCREKRDSEQKLELTLSSRFEQRARKAVHEAGNPLSIIKNYLKIVSQKLPDDNDVHQELEILREEIDRVTHILQHLTDLSESPPAMDTVDINAVIEGMLALYSESLFAIHGIIVEKRLDPALSTIPGDRDNVKQILLNLWKNAAEAMPEGGRFVISTRGNVIQNGRPHAEICLSDSGPGLPQEVVQRLFQPLDPNRRPGHSGIGLSIVASLVERLGGQIKNQHIEGQGASFFVLLPQFEVIEK
jgi:nitrogen-specific signal transduction histidine kinase